MITFDATENYRQILETKRAAILSALRFEQRHGQERVAEDDQGTVAHEEFVSMRINHLDYSQLRLIDEALDRIEAGDYGACLRCEDHIPEKRLRALPWAKYCVPCQEQVSAEAEPEYRQPLRLAS